MFFSKLMFTKHGPLAKVWLAAHQQKVTKSTVVSANIEESVHDIVDPSAPLALRLSGQLLLGVARIYQRKAKYLQEDCSDALTKIKMSFSTGAVDLPANAATANDSSITLQDGELGVDFVVPDIPLSQMVAMLDDAAFDNDNMAANESDITLEHSRAAPMESVFGVREDEELFGQEEAEIELHSMDALDETLDDKIEVARDAPSDMHVEDPLLDMNLDADAEIEILNEKTSENPLDVELPVDAELQDFGPVEINEAPLPDVAVDLDTALPQDNIRVKRKRSVTKIRSDAKTQIPEKKFKMTMKNTSELVCQRKPLDLSKRRHVSALLPSVASELRDLLLACSESSPIESAVPDVPDVSFSVPELPEEIPEPLEPEELIVPLEEDLPVDLPEESLPLEAEEPLELAPVPQLEAPEELEEPEYPDLLQTEAEEPPRPVEEDDDEEEVTKSGWSERTKKMYHLLENRLQNQPSVSVQEIVKGKSRSIAAGVFLECLVLKTHDYIELKQERPYDPLMLSVGARFQEPLPA